MLFFLFQTDSDEDVIFVSAKCLRKSEEVVFDQAKRLALQRDIDLQSQPEQPAWTSQRSVASERPAEKMKIKKERESSEEKLVKKEKKLKKGLASVPEDNSCAVDDGSQAEVKKEKTKKKGQKVEVVVIEAASDKREEKKKKKKKREVGPESSNDANAFDVKSENDEVVVKKKKKKGSVKEEEEEERDQRKEEKMKNKSVQIKPEHVKTEEEEEDQQAGKDKLPKKVKKEVLVSSKEETAEHVKEKKKKRKKKEETTEEETTEDMNGKSATKKKNKSKTKVCENEVKLEKPEEDNGDVVEVKVKKNKKKDAQIIEDENVVTPGIKGNKKRSKGEKDKSIKREIAAGEEEKTKRKEKGKKEKGGKASVEVREAEETEPKKKKRKKGSLMEGKEDEPLPVKCEEDGEQSEETPITGAETAAKKKSKKKKSSVNVETLMEGVSSGAGVKKKKIKEEVEDQHESPHVDVVFLSEKSGNADEVTINQERRQALQMEIDEASHPEKTAKPTGLGQWSTAQFDNSEQQQKFLRLMGGFKKGFQPATGSTGGANMALGKEAQQELQQGLLGEFERAHSRRMDFSSRGAGLGFAAPSNKKFFIDVNKCRSVRFDD